jgi:GT2 family glycosyltransferase
VLDSFTFSPHNTGQHPATNAAITSALADNYYALLRVDDDCKFLTRQWLTRMIDAALTLGPQFILSPAVKGLKNPMPTSTIAHKDNIPFVLLEAGVPLGGICRLIQAQTLRDYPYVSDVRKPMGLGDASGVGQWARANGLLCAYLKHVRVAHNTARQETEDSAHFTEHSLYQHIPYLPPWSPRG